VTTQLSLPPAVPTHEPVVERPRLLDRWRGRRQARAFDRRAVRLTELHMLRGLIADATGVLETGWVRGGWFAYLDEAGERRLATALTVHRAEGRPIVGACLVGAVVQAGGGLPAARSQPVQRALDLVWHALSRGDDEPVRWCPAPAVRAAHVRDLTRWNDRPSRTSAEAVALLRGADRLAAREITRLQR
jgi:hypothetical protein